MYLFFCRFTIFLKTRITYLTSVSEQWTNAFGVHMVYTHMFVVVYKQALKNTQKNRQITIIITSDEYRQKNQLYKFLGVLVFVFERATFIYLLSSFKWFICKQNRYDTNKCNDSLLPYTKTTMTNYPDFHFITCFASRRDNNNVNGG